MSFTTTVALALLCITCLASGQQLATDRYRREEVDPVNLAAEIDAILSSVSDSSADLSTVHSTIPTRATKGRVESMSNQVSALREIAGNRVFQAEVDGLSNLVGLVVDTADAVESIGMATSSMIPETNMNAETANSLATELFVNRVRQAGLVNRVDRNLASNLAPAIDVISDVQETLDNLVSGAPSVFQSLAESAAENEESYPISEMVRHFGGMFYRNKQLPVMRWAQWSTYNQNNQWYFGNRNDLTGGVAPSTWGDSNGRAYQMSTSADYMRALYNKRITCGWSCAPHNNEWYSYSSTNSHHGSVFIRVRNTTPNTITWTLNFFYSSYGGWNEYASVSLNDANTWDTSSNCGRCSRSQSLSIPGNDISTVVVIVSSSAQSGTRTMHLSFTEDCLRLPEGLEYVDDLDWITSL